MFNKVSGMCVTALGFTLMVACTLLNLSGGHTRLALMTEVMAGLNAVLFLLWLIIPTRRINE